MSRKDVAFVIGNDGLGDTLVCCGLINYLSTMYKKLFVACDIRNVNNIKHFFTQKNIILYPINKDFNTHMYEFCKMMLLHKDKYDIYAFGNYGAESIDLSKYVKTMHDKTIKKIIYDYPVSYYEDLHLPIEYATKYFSVQYPKNISDIYDDLLTNFPYYIVFHQKGSNVPSIDFVKHQQIDLDKKLVIDVNKNLYNKNHKFYKIAEKFINLSSIIYYTKLLENASELYLIDSCLHALALVIDVSKANPKICYQRESRFNYAFNKFDYYKLVFINNSINGSMKVDRIEGK